MPPKKNFNFKHDTYRGERRTLTFQAEETVQAPRKELNAPKGKSSRKKEEVRARGNKQNKCKGHPSNSSLGRWAVKSNGKELGGRGFREVINKENTE